MSIRHRIVALSVASTLILAGCGGSAAEFDDPSEPEGQSEERVPQEGSEEPEAAEESETPEASDGSGDPIRATWPDPDNAVADDVFTIPESEREKVRIGIEAIVVTDQTMELRLMLTPDEGGDGLRVWDVLREEANLDVRLIDRENLKEYTVLRTTKGSGRYAPHSKVRLTAGQTLAYPIFYAPPEDDIDTIDVRLSSHLPIFEDVPLTYEK